MFLREIKHDLKCVLKKLTRQAQEKGKTLFENFAGAHKKKKLVTKPNNKLEPEVVKLHIHLTLD